MSQEGAAKLRLKPRKAPPACSREPSPGRESPRRRLAAADRCSWFEKGDLKECEKAWLLLVKDISQDLQSTTWQTVPIFPEFSGKNSDEESLENEEVFTIGTKDFQWVPFPSFCKENHLKPKDLSSHQLTESKIDYLHKGQGQTDKLKNLPSTAEKTCCVTITDQAKNTVGGETEGISKLDASPKSCKLTQHTSSTHNVAVLQRPEKAFSFQQLCRETVQNSRENRRENDRRELQIQTGQGNISFGESRYVPSEEKPLASTPETESCKKTENQSEGSSTLDSCPMCLINFSRTLSQLDIDGHLARCLSESADDVMW